MQNSKFGNSEAIALMFTIIINQIMLSSLKSILSETHSSAILNVIYITAIALIISSIILKLLKKFPNSDILDISNFLGGKTLKFIVGIAFICYFTFFTALLLRNFCSFLQIVYYQLTEVIFITLLFLIAAILACNFKNNAVFKTNLIIFPLLILSIIFLFATNFRYFTLERIFPILGNGFNATFIQGFSNLFAFQGLCYIYFLPTNLQNPKEIKKITLISIILSGIYLLLCITIILFMFNAFIDTGELMPLYSAVRYIEFGTFIQRLDSVFLLIWIISFISYLSIVISFCKNIFKKITNIKNENFVILPLAFLILAISLIPQNYAISNFLVTDIYKYAFFIFAIGICISLLIIANFKKIRN